MLTRKRKNSPLTCPESATAARTTALRLLARREHTALELRHKLLLRGFAPAGVDVALQQLSAADLLSDSRFAEVYAHSRADKGYGPLRIRQELSERGVADDSVAAVLASLEDCWMPKLNALHRKRFAGILPQDAAHQAGQVRFLRHRGFTLDQIKTLFRSL